MKKIIIIIFAIVILSACSREEEKTNNIFLIPEGYEGSIMVYYDIPNEPLLKKEEEYSVIPVRLETLKELAGSQLNEYGIYLTSTSDMDYGIVNNLYFYLDSNGNRTRIDESCTHVMNSGSFTGGDGKAVRYQGVQITTTDCGEPFYLNGKKGYYLQKDEIQSHWMAHFDKKQR